MTHVRTGKEIRLANPTQFLAQERSVVDEGFAGDVVGVYDPGIFEIGDTLTGGTRFTFEAIPSFAPEHFRRLAIVDPMRRKQLAKASSSSPRRAPSSSIGRRRVAREMSCSARSGSSSSRW